MSPVSTPGPRGGGGGGGGVGDVLRADGDADVAAVEAHVDGAVAELGGDLRGEVGERVHQGQAGGGLERGAEQSGSALGLLVAGGRRRSEVVAQLRDVSTDVHDATVASQMASVKRAL